MNGNPDDDPLPVGEPYPGGCAGMLMCLALDAAIAIIGILISIIVR